MDRAITQEEINVIQWLVDHPRSNEPAGPWLVRIEDLRVVGGCGCGCCSIDFVSDEVGSRPARQAIGVTKDGRQNGLILWATENIIHSLEVFDLDPGASHELPEVASLRTWDPAR